MVGLDVRVSDATAGDALSTREHPRHDLPGGGTTPDRVRERAPGTLGDLRGSLCGPRHPPRLSLPGLWRPGARVRTGFERGPGSGAIRNLAGDDGRAAGCGGEPDPTQQSG